MNTTQLSLFNDIIEAYKSATKEDPAESYQKTYYNSIAILVDQAFMQQGQAWAEVTQLPRTINKYPKNSQIKSRVHWLLHRQISKVYVPVLNEKIASASSEKEKNEWNALLSMWNRVDQQYQDYYKVSKGGVIAFGGQANVFLPKWLETPLKTT